MECCICYEPDNLIEYNHCGKVFVHQKCLESWDPNLNVCFLCRKTVLPPDNINETQDIIIEVNEINNINNNRCVVSLCWCVIPVAIFGIICLISEYNN
jgi:hypothetical protein